MRLWHAAEDMCRTRWGVGFRVEWVGLHEAAGKNSDSGDEAMRKRYQNDPPWVGWAALTLLLSPVALLLTPRNIAEFLADTLAVLIGIAVWLFVIGWIAGKIGVLRNWIRRKVT